MSNTDPTLTNEGYQLLPAGSEPPSADDALALEDTLANPDALAVAQRPPVPLGRAPAIDFAARRFVPNTAGGPLMIYGIDTLKQWAQKCLKTRRGENPAVDPEFGMDRLFVDLIDGSPYDESTFAEFESIAERALSVHPDIDAVDEWTIDYTADDDAAFVSFVVIPAADGEDPLSIDVSLPATGAASA